MSDRKYYDLDSRVSGDRRGLVQRVGSSFTRQDKIPGTNVYLQMPLWEKRVILKGPEAFCALYALTQFYTKVEVVCLQSAMEIQHSDGIHDGHLEKWAAAAGVPMMRDETFEEAYVKQGLEIPETGVLITCQYEGNMNYGHVVCIPPLPSMQIDDDPVPAFSNLVAAKNVIPEEISTVRKCVRSFADKLAKIEEESKTNINAIHELLKPSPALVSDLRRSLTNPSGIDIVATWKKIHALVFKDGLNLAKGDCDWVDWLVDRQIRAGKPVKKPKKVYSILSQFLQMSSSKEAQKAWPSKKVKNVTVRGRLNGNQISLVTSLKEVEQQANNFSLAHRAALNSPPPGRINYKSNDNYSHIKVNFFKSKDVVTGFSLEPLMHGQLSATAKEALSNFGFPLPEETKQGQGHPLLRYMMTVIQSRHFMRIFTQWRDWNRDPRRRAGDIFYVHDIGAKYGMVLNLFTKVFSGISITYGEFLEIAEKLDDDKIATLLAMIGICDAEQQRLRRPVFYHAVNRHYTDN